MLKTSNKAVKRLCQILSKRSVAVSSVKASTCAALLFNISIKAPVFRTFGSVIRVRREQNFNFNWYPSDGQRTGEFLKRLKTSLKTQLKPKEYSLVDVHESIIYSRSFYSKETKIKVDGKTDLLISTVDKLYDACQYARESVAAIELKTHQAMKSSFRQSFRTAVVELVLMNISSSHMRTKLVLSIFRKVHRRSNYLRS